jgi:hypothetical protein
MPYEDLVYKLLKRGNANAADLDQLLVQVTHAKVNEMNDAIRRGTRDRPVKVITLVSGPPPARVDGYITQERFLAGKTPNQMRDILGLRPIDLATGARVLALTETLEFTDLENKGYTYLPDGKVYTGGDYPPGSGAGQWRLIKKTAAKLVEDLLPGVPYSLGRATAKTGALPFSRAQS